MQSGNEIIASRKNLSDSYRLNLYLTFLDICRAHLVISQFSDKSYGTEVIPTCAFILAELKLNPNLNLSALAKLLNLDKSTISRAVSQLIEQRYILKSSGYQILKRGEAFLALQDSFNDNQLKLLAANLSKSELNRFAELFWEFAEEQKAPAANLASKDPKHIILIAIRRVTRLWGITGNQAFESQFSSTDWLILSELYYNKLNLSQLSEKLHTPLNTLSQRISKYHRQKLIEYYDNEADQRSKLILLSKQGLKSLFSIEKKAQQLFGKSLDQKPIKYIEEFIELFRKYTFSQTKYRAYRYDQDSYFMQTIDQKDLATLRWLKVSQLQKTEAKEKANISEYFFSNRNINFKLMSNNGTIGALELLTESDASLRIVNLVLPDNSDLQACAKAIIPILGKLTSESITIRL